MFAIESLAEWTLADHEPFRSDAALKQARLLLLDSLGCACAAIEAGAVDALLEATMEIGGAPVATVIGHPYKTSVPNAALVNGALIRVLDFNDVVFAERNGKLSVAGHPSENIPVALAIAEAFGGTGRAMLEAICINYEVYGRLRELIPDGGPWDGASASGIAAAAVAGRLLGLDANRQAQALALAAARSPTPKIVRNGDISATKSLANAFVAQAGVHSALLAAKRITGPLAILDDRKAGIFQVFDPDLGLSRLWRPVDTPKILGTHLKSYPSIGTSQTAIAAALQARKTLGDRIAEIEAIEITMADVPDVRRQQSDQARRRPKTREAADHSFTYLVATALTDGEVTHRQFTGDRWLSDQRVLTLMERTTLAVSQTLAAKAKDSMPCSVRLLLRGGEMIEVDCLEPPGRLPGGSLDAGIVEAKFHNVSRGVTSDEQRVGIIASVMALDDHASLVELLRKSAAISAE